MIDTFIHMKDLNSRSPKGLSFRKLTEKNIEPLTLKINSYTKRSIDNTNNKEVSVSFYDDPSKRNASLRQFNLNENELYETGLINAINSFKIKDVADSIKHRDILNAINYSSSLLEIGKIIFKDSRDLLPDEIEAMKNYNKKKYKKINDT